MSRRDEFPPLDRDSRVAMMWIIAAAAASAGGYLWFSI
jgi:hypothetical protein